MNLRTLLLLFAVAVGVYFFVEKGGCAKPTQDVQQMFKDNEDKSKQMNSNTQLQKQNQSGGQK